MNECMFTFKLFAYYNTFLDNCKEQCFSKIKNLIVTRTQTRIGDREEHRIEVKEIKGEGHPAAEMK